MCVLIPKQKVPLMIQKSDGGFNYEATDLAALKYRIQDLKCDRIVYITDIGQKFHFQSVFKGAQICGFYDPKKTQVDHMGFGLMKQEEITVNEKGEQVKTVGKIKTRSGNSIKLK